MVYLPTLNLLQTLENMQHKGAPTEGKFMTPTMYLDQLISEIRNDRQEEFDRFIFVLDAFYQTQAITDQEFLNGFDFLVACLAEFGVTREVVEDMFTSIPDNVTT